MDGLINGTIVQLSADKQQSLRPHVVLIPLPVQSHMNPFTSLARLLVDNGVSVTFVYTSRTYKKVMAASDNSSDLLKSTAASENIYRIEVLSDDTEYGGGSADNKKFDTFKSSLHQMRIGTEKLLERYLAVSEGDGCGGAAKNHISALIMDSFIPWGWQVAAKYGLCKIDVWTSNAVLFSMGLHVPDLRDKGYLPPSPLSDEDKQRVVDFIPGLTPFRIAELPCMWTSDPTPNNVILEFTLEVFKNIKNTDRTLLNSIYEMEQHTIDALRENDNIRLDCIGPLPSASNNNNNNDNYNCNILSSFLREDTSCLTWLDARDPGTVLYVSFGSLAQLAEDVIAELALGVEASGVAFLWVARPGLVAEKEDIFPAGFKERTAGRGLVVEWAPQQSVLAHPAIGAFLSHCGWNSTIESLAAGVPILGFPISAEQNTNLKYIVNDWRVGLPLIPGLLAYPPTPAGYNAEICGRRVVEESVNNVMAGGAVREKALKWKCAAAAAVAGDPAGSSYRNLHSLVRDLKTCGLN